MLAPNLPETRMCSAPKIDEPIQRQAALPPTYREDSKSGASRGRRGTILTGSEGVMDSQVPARKTLLGQ
jgi:hypothetical protein